MLCFPVPLKLSAAQVFRG